MDDKFTDINSLIFEGCLKETIKFDNFVVVVRTLFVAEEDNVIEIYKHLPQNYNLLAVADTIKSAIYLINGCKIPEDNEFRHIIYDWPKQIILKIFAIYLELVKRSRAAIKLLQDFIKTDESKLRWSVLKATKTSLNSAVITGNNDFSDKGLSYLQQVWIYLNEQEDKVADNKHEWSRVEYMTESICAFINPKAMRQIHGQKKMQEEQLIEDKKEENMQLKDDAPIIENTADKLFDSIQKRSDETTAEYRKRMQNSIVEAFTEDEHDKIVREIEETEFRKQLRIKKENARRSKILREKRFENSVIIDVPQAPNGLQVGFHQVSTFDDVSGENTIVVQETGQYIINDVDYSDVIEITSFLMLRNRDQILQEVANESEEETTKWIESYIAEDQRQSDVMERLREMTKGAFKTSTDEKEAMLERRDRILSNKNRFEDEQEQMKSQIKKQM
ncbi:MAG: hypothetical protein Q7R33_01985 [Nitrosarchaeum sp.]|nr:hypothetical protein [Nitrosarchaeum sp.]